MKQLKCNFPPCETVIAGSGFVTKCSHVFCMKCAANNGLAAESALSSRKCPVCQKPLQQRLDTHEHSLSPPDGWKDLVLAGLAPKDILDCAGRALGFWQYQISTHYEILEEKLAHVKGKLTELEDRYVVDQASAQKQIERLTRELRVAKAEEERLTSTVKNLSEIVREKNTAISQLKERNDHLQNVAYCYKQLKNDLASGTHVPVAALNAAGGKATSPTSPGAATAGPFRHPTPYGQPAQTPGRKLHGADERDEANYTFALPGIPRAENTAMAYQNSVGGEAREYGRGNAPGGVGVLGGVSVPGTPSRNMQRVHVHGTPSTSIRGIGNHGPFTFQSGLGGASNGSVAVPRSGRFYEDSAPRSGRFHQEPAPRPEHPRRESLGLREHGLGSFSDGTVGSNTGPTQGPGYFQEHDGTRPGTATMQPPPRMKADPMMESNPSADDGAVSGRTYASRWQHGPNM